MRKIIPLVILSALLTGSMGFLFIEHLQDDEKKAKPLLGVFLGDVTEQAAKRNNLDEARGALIANVTYDGPAHKAGLMSGDIVVDVDGVPIASADDLRSAIEAKEPGDVVSITVVRHGRSQTLNVELGEQKAGMLRSRFAAVAPGMRLNMIKPYVAANVRNRIFQALFAAQYHLGVEYQELNDELGAYFGRPEGDGVLVTSVEKDSPAEKAGMKAGDVIISVNGAEIADGSDLRKALSVQYDHGEDDAAEDESEDTMEKTLQVDIIRREQPMTLSVTVEAKKRGFYNYRYRIGKESIEKERLLLRERLIPRLKEQFYILGEPLEELEELEHLEILPEIAMLGPEPDIMIPDLQMITPDLEMIPELDLVVPDLGIDWEILDGEDLDGLFWLNDGSGFRLSIDEDGGVIFNGEEFKSIDAFKEYLQELKEQKREGLAPVTEAPVVSPIV